MALENIRNWYGRRVEKPYEHLSDEMGASVYINLETTPASLTPAQQTVVDDTLRRQGANLILSYYGKVPLIQASNIELADVLITQKHTPKRPYSSPIIQVRIPLTLVEDTDDIPYAITP